MAFRVRVVTFTSDADRVLTDDEALDGDLVVRAADGVTVSANRKLILPHAPTGKAHGYNILNELPGSLRVGGLSGAEVTLLGAGVGIPRRCISVGGNYR